MYGTPGVPLEKGGHSMDSFPDFPLWDRGQGPWSASPIQLMAHIHESDPLPWLPIMGPGDGARGWVRPLGGLGYRTKCPSPASPQGTWDQGPWAASLVNLVVHIHESGPLPWLPITGPGDGARGWPSIVWSHGHVQQSEG